MTNRPNRTTIDSDLVSELDDIELAQVAGGFLISLAPPPAPVPIPYPITA
jgi:hypothetical protein